MEKTAVIFPAFGSNPLGNERDIIASYSYDFNVLINRASGVSGISIEDCTLEKNDNQFLEKELREQILYYIYSCAVSDILKIRGIEPVFTAGYSMGLYASLYYNESIGFEDGIKLIVAAYRLLSITARNLDYGMGTIVGLSHHELNDLIISEDADVEIININNNHQCLIAGNTSGVQTILDSAKAGGALSAKSMPMMIPYHSSTMDDAAREFRYFAESVTVNDPRFSLVSTIDQRILRTGKDIIDDLAANINTAINWLLTMEVMIRNGSRIFIECGPGKSLYRIGKFIDGDFSIYPLNMLHRIIRPQVTFDRD